MKFVLFHLLPVISFVIPLSSFAAEVEESIDPETYCITHAKRLILENDQTVNNGITFNNCLKASSGSNPTLAE